MSISTLLSCALVCALISLPFLAIYAIWKAVSNSLDRSAEEARERLVRKWETKMAENGVNSKFAADFRAAQKRFNQQWEAAGAHSQRWSESGQVGPVSAAAAAALAGTGNPGWRHGSSPHDDLFSQSSIGGDPSIPMVNPATGLLIAGGGIDIGGNPMGVDLDHH